MTSTNKPDGGPAFPTGHDIRSMTMRDYFATAAITVLYNPQFTAEMIARYSYEIADAMITERAK